VARLKDAAVTHHVKRVVVGAGGEVLVERADTCSRLPCATVASMMSSTIGCHRVVRRRPVHEQRLERQ
jgi:hypothetical protein